MLTWTLRVFILSFGLIYYFLLSSSVFYYSLSCLFICLEARVLGEMTLEAMLVVYLNKSYWDEKSRWLQSYNKSDWEAHHALERSCLFKGISHLDLWLRDLSCQPSWSSTVCRKFPLCCLSGSGVLSLLLWKGWEMWGKQQNTATSKFCQLSRLCPVSCLSGKLCTKDAASATGKSQLRRFSCFLEPSQHQASSEQDVFPSKLS